MFQSVWVSLPLRVFICLFVQGISSEARVVSMAFLKSYAFFVLILFPCSLHVVHALNYATFNPHSNFMLRWSYDNNKLIFNMTCKVMGWCAVGFTETDTGTNMAMYDIAAGGVASNTPYLKVSFCISQLYFSIMKYKRQVNWSFCRAGYSRLRCEFAQEPITNRLLVRLQKTVFLKYGSGKQKFAFSERQYCILAVFVEKNTF